MYTHIQDLVLWKFVVDNSTRKVTVDLPVAASTSEELSNSLRSSNSVHDTVYIENALTYKWNIVCWLLAGSDKVKKLIISKWLQNWRTKRLQQNPHKRCVWNATTNVKTSQFGLSNGVRSSYRGKTQTDTQNDYSNPLGACVPRVN